MFVCIFVVMYMYISRWELLMKVINIVYFKNDDFIEYSKLMCVYDVCFY